MKRTWDDLRTSTKQAKRNCNQKINEILIRVSYCIGGMIHQWWSPIGVVDPELVICLMPSAKRGTDVLEFLWRTKLHCASSPGCARSSEDCRLVGWSMKFLECHRDTRGGKTQWSISHSSAKVEVEGMPVLEAGSSFRKTVNLPNGDQLQDQK